MRNAVAFTIIGLSAAIAAEPCARAQTAADVVGTWQMVSVVNTTSDGKRIDTFGPDVKGLTIFTADGHYSQVFMRPDLPKFASGSRLTGTPEENSAIVHGSIAHSGTYTVNGKTLVLHALVGTWPAWNGVDQVRTITDYTKDMLTYSSSAAIGGSNVTVLKRVP